MLIVFLLVLNRNIKVITTTTREEYQAVRTIQIKTNSLNIKSMKGKNSILSIIVVVKMDKIT